MRLINKTDYPTEVLKELLREVYKSEPRLGKLRTWNGGLDVTVQYSKTYRADSERRSVTYTGYAYLSGRASTLRVPRPGCVYTTKTWLPKKPRRAWSAAPEEYVGLDPVAFAALWRHELWHLYGIKHRDYPSKIMSANPTSVEHVDLSGYPQIIAAIGKDSEHLLAAQKAAAELKPTAALTELDKYFE